MLDKKDKKYYDVQGALYYDPVMPYADELRLDQAAFPAFFRHWESVFAIPNKNKKILENDNEKCGLDKYREAHLTYPLLQSRGSLFRLRDVISLLTLTRSSLSSTLASTFTTFRIPAPCFGIS
ncbi:hypothetical protein NXS19_007952 [Fusarium pseudograminearum]|nr:hypothetical protein NXS19_007952 [Fusarium pseudograminearum]